MQYFLFLQKNVTFFWNYRLIMRPILSLLPSILRWALPVAERKGRAFRVGLLSVHFQQYPLFSVPSARLLPA